MKYAARVEYNGSGFSGWQTQKHGVRTVQQCVEKSLSKVADTELSIITAGRTDTAVHATHQVIHFESPVERSEFAWCRGANRFMPADVRLHWVQAVDDDFHARFSALSRSYRFVIYNNSIHSAIHQHTSTFEYRELDIERMRLAAKYLLGEHDFSSFRAAGCQAHSAVRTISSFTLCQRNEWVWFDVTANAFLQHMVRNIAGVLIEVGSGKREVDWVQNLLHVKDRTKASITAKANGLYLTGVRYADKFALPSQQKMISFWNKQP